MFQEFYRNLVLAAGTVDGIASQTLQTDVLVEGQDAALVKVAVLDDLEDGQVLAKFGQSQQLGFSVHLLLGQFADVVPGLALTGGAAFHGVVDGVVSVVAGHGSITEDAGGSIQLQLQLRGQGALEVDDPQRLFLANGDAFDLKFNSIKLILINCN
jgi:hypothetical protein